MTEDIEMHRLEDVQPGMIMFGPIGGAVGVGVGLGQLALGEGLRLGTMSIRHAGIVTEASRTLSPGTVRNLSTGEWFDGGDGYPSVEGGLLDEYEAYPTGVITGPRLVEAMPSGARIVDMKTDTHWTERHAYVWLPEEYPGQNADAAAVAAAMEGIPYSWASYLSLALFRFGVRQERLLRWIDRRQEPGPEIRRAGPWPGQLYTPSLPVEAICSVLADQAHTLAGRKMVYGTQPQAVTPGRLAQALLQYPGARWFRPAPPSETMDGWKVSSWTVGG